MREKQLGKQRKRRRLVLKSGGRLHLDSPRRRASPSAAVQPLPQASSAMPAPVCLGTRHPIAAVPLQTVMPNTSLGPVVRVVPPLVNPPPLSLPSSEAPSSIPTESGAEASFGTSEEKDPPAEKDSFRLMGQSKRGGRTRVVPLAGFIPRAKGPISRPSWKNLRK
ncbi:hypothetical protein PVAP13_7NG044500 [Panicum virgatum]|uniref:Uncharacterized protein n=1 Tax=Panicum virgatum TaxID=38727 RepID=A0A8T0PRW0_PANVG|nr:hypothetical protein PVAP13_7NG044500 [Panicum virgatum]KAG2564733.1 hypothetical protein PVAP13_7NG044500 [Panicum virgatum]KAG2564734.1 hypothetical protein PVAP13_7NG044500 [Panicum virgatum]